MRISTLSMGIATLGLAAALGASTWNDAPDEVLLGTPEVQAAWEAEHRTPQRGVSEDEAAWNCWTMGNGSCGTMLTVPGEGDTRGAVLPRAADTGRATVAWSNGPVTDAPRWLRYVAWRGCVGDADGSDASMHQCDEDWQYADERFDMSTAHCYSEAWINDDPDARMLAVCDA